MTTEISQAGRQTDRLDGWKDGRRNDVMRESFRIETQASRGRLQMYYVDISPRLHSVSISLETKSPPHTTRGGGERLTANGIQVYGPREASLRRSTRRYI